MDPVELEGASRSLGKRRGVQVFSSTISFSNTTFRNLDMTKKEKRRAEASESYVARPTFECNASWTQSSSLLSRPRFDRKQAELCASDLSTPLNRAVARSTTTNGTGRLR